MDWVTEWWWHFHVKEERRRKKEERRKKRKEGRMAWKFWHSDFPKVSRHLIFNYSISFLKKIQIWFWHLYFLNYVILLTYLPRHADTVATAKFEERMISGYHSQSSPAIFPPISPYKFFPPSHPTILSNFLCSSVFPSYFLLPFLHLPHTHNK